MSTSSQAPIADDEPLVIPPPRADRPPLHANLLNTMQQANTTLAPLFPYLHAGAIVPTGALFIGGPGRDYGQFYHHNSVDEIIIAFVAREATLETGQLYNGGRVHGVNSFLKDQTKAGSFAVFTVTQRQPETDSQPEALSMLCKGCRKPLYRYEWDEPSSAEARELDSPFPTPIESGVAVRRFNDDPKLRTCEACGLVNPPFPVHTWGWEQYDLQSKVMRLAKQVLADAGARCREGA